MFLFEAVVTKGKVIEQNHGKRIPLSSDVQINLCGQLGWQETTLSTLNWSHCVREAIPG